MASTMDHEITKTIVVNQAIIEEHFRVLRKHCEQLSNRGINDAFGLEDAVKTAIEEFYQQKEYQVVPIAYTSVYGPSGKILYSFDFAYEARRLEDDEKLMLIGEAKFNLSCSDVESFVHKVGKLKTRFTKVRAGTMRPDGAINYASQIDLASRLLEHKVVKLVAGWRILPEAVSKATDAECHLVATDGSHFTVHHYNDVSESITNQLVPPSSLSQDEDEV